MPEVDIQFPNKLLPIIKAKNRYVVLYGGRGGAKSWGVAGTTIIRALEKKLLILCTREIQNTIKDSVHKTLCDTIERYGLSEYFDIKRDYITAVNGSKFIFKGLKHSVSEIKSLEGVDICWTEEAHNISQESWDVLLPTIRKDGSQIFIVYNPDSEQAPVHQDFVINQMYDSMVIKINYDENPFFPDTLRKLMEWDKLNNYEKYQHIWLGQVKAISDACIFKGRFTVDTFETHKDVDFYFGADWGFSVDPAVLVRCYPYDGNLYIDYEAYGVGVEIDELPQFLDMIPGSRENIITADSARPDTISYVRNKRFHIKGAKKGPKSIEDGIAFLKSFKKVIIHTRCKNTKYEFENYSYKKDKITEEILPIIQDKHNHCFIGETMVATDKGEIPIKDINIGDMVLTRKGYKRVLKKFNNGIKRVKTYKFANKMLLTGTDTHKIITPSGKVYIKDIDNHELYFLRSNKCRIIKAKNQKLSYSMMCLSDVIQTVREGMTEYITRHINMVRTQTNTSMYLYGRSCMGLSQKGTTYTIKTGIHPITTSIIWRLYFIKNTFLYILKNTTETTKAKLKGILNRSDISQKNGMAVQRGESGIGHTLKTQSIRQKIKSIYVSIVGLNILPRRKAQTNSAPINVNQHGGGRKVLTILKRFVLYVTASTRSINIVNRKPAQEVVQTEQEVFDIMVEDEHEYFANGVLVSNCIDSLRYATERLRKGINQKQEAPGMSKIDALGWG